MKIFSGVDIVSISRFTDELLQKQSFLNLCFTQAEQDYCLSKSNPAQHFAVRFAAKEAVTKAISGLNRVLAYSAIEIKHGESGRPFVVFHSDDEVLQKIEIDISLSHSETSAIAFAIVYLP